MNLSKMSREQLIELVLQRELDSVVNAVYKNDVEYIYFILKTGFKGFENYSIEELKTELNYLTSEDL